jgi:DNA-binding NtrC family response regulator
MTPRGSILVVDDEPKLRHALERALRENGYDVAGAGGPHAAERLLADHPCDVAIVDNVMPDMSGLDLIRAIARTTDEARRPQFVVMTAYATIDDAIQAMKLGAIDYLQKPFAIEELLVVVGRALDHRRLSIRCRDLRQECDAQFDNYGIIGTSRAVQSVIRQVDLVAPTTSTVLLTGETGTGKELVARAIHQRSPRRDRPLVKVNCAAIPETMLESELFGHVRGAFTDAVATKRGKFALADGGTVFLDEIATMAAPLQARMVRVIQDREFEPLGAEESQTVDVRVIAATNRDLKRMIADGRFQIDLFYRLNVISIDLQPLRERREDIPLLVDHFVQQYARRMNRHVEGVDPVASAILQEYDWPGNIRELENAIERAVVLCRDPIIGSAFFTGIAPARPAPVELPSLELKRNVEWVERQTLERALERAQGFKKGAAALMGVSPRGLSYYVKKYLRD